MMSPLSDFMINENSTLLQAVEQIERNHSRAVIVTADEKVVGVLSEGDILRAFLKGANIHAPIESFMVHSFKFLTERDMPKAYRWVKKYLFTLIPVLDENFYLVDVITLSEILDHINHNIS